MTPQPIAILGTATEQFQSATAGTLFLLASHTIQPPVFMPGPHTFSSGAAARGCKLRNCCRTAGRHRIFLGRQSESRTTLPLSRVRAFSGSTEVTQMVHGPP